MQHRTILAAILVAALAGCTHRQLDHSTVLTTSTVMDIQYRTVLMNLAKLSSQPEALPSHADLADGVVQINDRLGFGQGGGFTTFSGGTYGFGLDRFGPTGQRQVTEQWGADATTDPQRLTDLQDLYRVALGLPPLPPPNAIAYLRRQEAEEREKSSGNRTGKGEKGTGEKDGSERSSSRESSESQARVRPASFVAASGGNPSTASTGGGGSTPSSHSGSSGDAGRGRVPIEILLTDVPPPGWFHLGCKKDVPKDACYVGCYGDRYAWVMPDGVAELSRFTVTVLSVIKLKPGEAGKSHGLAVGSP